MANVSRRGFLAGLIALSTTALAAKLVLPSEAMAEEVREGLIKDLNKKPVSIFDMRDIKQIEPVWASVAGTSQYWRDELVKQISAKVDEMTLKALTEGYGAPMKQLGSMTRKLAQQIDTDLREAQVPVAKQLIIGMPHWEIVQQFGQPAIQLKAGLRENDTIWGKEHRVEYIRPTELILPGLDKRGLAEYSGLILT